MAIVGTSSTTQTPTGPFMADGVSHGVGTPLWWVYRLEQRLKREITGQYIVRPDGVLIWRDGLAKLERYYDGDHDLPWVRDAETRAEYLRMIERSRSNFMRLVVNAAAERSTVLGLRLPGDDEVADTETWAIWQRNEMEYWAPIAYRTALSQRRSYLSVWWDQTDNSKARIAVEDPQQCIVEHEPGDRSRRAAGLKMWVDDWTGATHANLYLPTEIHYFAWMQNPARSGGAEGWYPRSPAVRNQLGVVPLIPMVNQPNMVGDGVSELDDLIPIQDRINESLLNRQVAEHLSAFRQKWATGLEIPVDEKTGELVQPYKAAIDTIWLATDDKAKFGQFDSVDMKNYQVPIEQDLEHLSVLSRTPRHVFMHQGQAPSGDSMKSDESGLVSKVRGQQRSSFGPAQIEALRLARRIENLTTPLDSEIVWADPEWQTFAQLVDGNIKMVQAKVSSLDYAREKLGMTPATIRRVRSEILADAFTDGLLEPVVEPDGAVAAV